MSRDEAMAILQAAGRLTAVVQHVQIGHHGTQAWISIRIPSRHHPRIAAAVECILNSARRDGSDEA